MEVQEGKEGEERPAVLSNGISAFTEAFYEFGANKYECGMRGINTEPYPVSEQKLILFVTMFSEHIRTSTAASYIVAVRYRCRKLNSPMPESADMPRLQRLIHALMLCPATVQDEHSALSRP
jgi:hypothetical protein